MSVHPTSQLPDYKMHIHHVKLEFVEDKIHSQIIVFGSVFGGGKI